MGKLEQGQSQWKRGLIARSFTKVSERKLIFLVDVCDRPQGLPPEALA